MSAITRYALVKVRSPAGRRRSQRFDEDTRQPEEAAIKISPASGKRWLIVVRGGDSGTYGAPGRLLADPVELPHRAGAVGPISP